MDGESLERQNHTQPPSDNADNAPVCSMKPMHESPIVKDNPKRGQILTCLLSSDESGDENRPKIKIWVPGRHWIWGVKWGGTTRLPPQIGLHE